MTDRTNDMHLRLSLLHYRFFCCFWLKRYMIMRQFLMAFNSKPFKRLLIKKNLSYSNSTDAIIFIVCKKIS